MAGSSAEASGSARQANIGGANYGIIYMGRQGDQPDVNPGYALLPAIGQLPADPSDFTGRTTEAQILMTRFDPPMGSLRVATISGKPGVGKSALAVHVARMLEPRFPDGQLYADLRGLEQPVDPEDILVRFLAALGIRHDDPQVVAAGLDAIYRSTLQGKRMLIVLDNATDERQVRPILPGGGFCGVMITSRVPLAGLEGAFLLPLDVLPMDEAMMLLQEVSGRRLEEEEAAVAAVATDCGRLPLALRIAGGILKKRPHWNVARLRTELADERTRLDRLTIGHLDVRATFAVSYRELPHELARAFRFLGLIDDSTFDASMLSDLLIADTAIAETTLELLVEEQLVEVVPGGDFRLHDLLRLFAKQKAMEKEGPEDVFAAQSRLLHGQLSRFDEHYRRDVDRRFGAIALSFDMFHRTARTDDLYVDLQLRGPGNEGERRYLSTSSLHELLDVHQRVLLVGAAGSGKTTVARRICRSEALNGTRLPFFLSLKDYASRPEKSLVEYLAWTVNATVERALSQEMLITCFASGRALVVLDGLDEVIDGSVRARVIEDIRVLVTTFPQLAVIVTSRLVGRPFDSLQDDGFRSYELLPLSQTTINDYIRRRFKLFGTFDGEPDRAMDLTSQFMVATREVDDLRQTPLLLSLLASVYRIDHQLPASRLELYRKVADLLLRTWDQRRNIGGQGDVSGFAEYALSEVAFWAQSAPERRHAPIPQEILHMRIAAYLTDSQFESPARSADAAMRLIEHLSARSSLLSEVGVSDNGEPVFAFSHLVLQEYFAASFLVRTWSRARDLAEVIASYLHDAGFDETALLSLELRDRTVVDGGGAVLRELVEDRRGVDPIRLIEFVRAARRRVSLKGSSWRYIADKLGLD